MKNVLLVLELIVTIGLISSILIQAKGTGLGSSFGGGGEFFRSKRGVEKIIVYVTIFLVASFAAISIALLLMS